MSPNDAAITNKAKEDVVSVKTELSRLPISICRVRLGNIRLSSVFSFEAIFTLFLFAGRYKGDPRFEWIPIDLTLMFFCFNVLSFIFIFFRQKLKVSNKSLKLVLISLPFFFYTSSTIIWAPKHFYAIQKTLYISILTFWCFISCAVIIASSRNRVFRFMFFIVLFSGWLAFESIMTYSRARGGNIYALGSNYLGLGRVIGLALLILLVYRIFASRHSRWKLAITALLFFYSFVLLILGGRGPLLSTFASVVFLLFFGIKISRSHQILFHRYMISLIILFFFSILFILCFADNIALQTVQRVMALGDTTFPRNLGVRWEFFMDAFHMWIQAPVFGHGVGAFALFSQGASSADYPHNIILETLAEFGLFGFALLIVLFVYALRLLWPWKSLRRDPYRILFLILFINALCNAMVSADIPGNRVLFAIVGLMAMPKHAPSSLTLSTQSATDHDPTESVESKCIGCPGA